MKRFLLPVAGGYTRGLISDYFFSAETPGTLSSYLKTKKKDRKSISLA
jgi:hypothetical protein